MGTTIELIKSLPDISFIDGEELTDVQDEMMSAFQEKYKEITGVVPNLARGDPVRVILLASAEIFYQTLQKIDKAGKMNFIKYATGEYLDLIAATRSGIIREGASAATTNVVWRLESARQAATPIPQGSRTTADGSILFETQEYAEIPAGDTEITLTMVCTVTGTEGNGYAPGEITTMVDPVPFIHEITNTDTSSGGADVEDDESLEERTFLAPSGFSVAGPEEAYIYRCKEYSSLISDVAVSGHEEDSSIPEGTVDIRIMMSDGTSPEQSVIDGLMEYLTAAPARPLTDHVVISGPDMVTYNITLTYYIAASDRTSADGIQDAVEAAVASYSSWQSARIGRDINPDELIAAVKNAGAKRAVITNPTFTVLSRTQLARLGTVSITYGGLEND